MQIDREIVEQAIEILDLVLGYDGDVFGVYHNNATDTVSALRTALEKPAEVEPIGEVYEADDTIGTILRINWVNGRYPDPGTKLYTAPPDDAAQIEKYRLLAIEGAEWQKKDQEQIADLLTETRVLVRQNGVRMEQIDKLKQALRTRELGLADKDEQIAAHTTTNSILSSIIESHNTYITKLEATNATLLQWKGEIDSRRIALDLPFPDDYDHSAKYAVQSLIDAEIERKLEITWEALELFANDQGTRSIAREALEKTK